MTQSVSELKIESTSLARQLFFDDAEGADRLLAKPILRSWQRCRHLGLAPITNASVEISLDRIALSVERERNFCLLTHGRPIMEHLYSQIQDSGSMVILAAASGYILETVGDAEFLSRANRVALTAGVSWDETLRGTNAIGTALAEENSVVVHGQEHYLERNGFLTCCASPIFGPDAQLVGVIDISGDFRCAQPHTLGLTRFSAAIIEKQLFESLYGQGILIAFHSRADYLNSPQEGLAAISRGGHILAMNRHGVDMLGMRHAEVVGRDFFMVFECNLATLVDRQRVGGLPTAVRINRREFFLRLRGQLPSPSVARHVHENAAAVTSQKKKATEEFITLDAVDTGDECLHAALTRAKRILGKDIPLLIQGESGVGKEIFAKAFHNSGPRKASPFVALNCVAIPETLIESELFGYQGGAFTGARREGATGKLQQADGGTLFLDEIGDMPLKLQARLLRALQERSVTPLGGTRAVAIDISLICATHRKLDQAVAQGYFREDLYYRLNSMVLTLPALRERSDLRPLIEKITAQITSTRTLPVQFSEGAFRAMERFSWPGNIRQLFNIISVATAMLDEREFLITEQDLPEEMSAYADYTEPRQNTENTESNRPAANNSRLEDIERQAARQALDAAGGNISQAARQLGISRNTLYRKVGRMNSPR